MNLLDVRLRVSPRRLCHQAMHMRMQLLWSESAQLLVQ
jgi:hypothetical protein